MRNLHVLLVALAASLAACGMPSDGGGPGPGGGQVPTGDARVLLAWTLDGRAPSGPSCSGVDHLVLDLYFQSGASVEIEPIPCNLAKVRYDNLPDGPVQLDLAGFDATGAPAVCGTGTTTLSSTLPASPDPVIDLAPSNCR